MMTIICDESNGRSYQSYLGYHGALLFVCIDLNGNATNRLVPYHICEQLTPDGWHLRDNLGLIEAYRPVERLDKNLLGLGGAVYQYMIIVTHDGCQSYEFYNEYQEEVRNLAIRGSLRYFLNNERSLKK